MRNRASGVTVICDGTKWESEGSLLPNLFSNSMITDLYLSIYFEALYTEKKK